MTVETRDQPRLSRLQCTLENWRTQRITFTESILFIFSLIYHVHRKHRGIFRPCPELSARARTRDMNSLQLTGRLYFIIGAFFFFSRSTFSLFPLLRNILIVYSQKILIACLWIYDTIFERLIRTLFLQLSGVRF